MNVVMIGPFAFTPKGTVRARTFLIGKALAKRGHRVTILIPPYDNLSDSGRRWAQDGVEVENLRMRRNDFWHQAVVPVQLARRAAKLRPDVVHLFKPIGYSGMAGWYLRSFTRLSLVLDTDDWEGQGGWSGVNPYPAMWRALFTWQERWLARHSHAVTVASRTLETQVWGFGVAPDQVHYLPNGPDDSLRDPSRTDQPESTLPRDHLGIGDAPMALYLGMIPHGTDLDYAVEAFALVREMLPEARFVVAGVGEGLAGLRARAQDLGVSDSVLFPGWINHEQAGSYIAAADVIVNPYRDTLVNRAKCAGKVVAAMAMGKAVVTSNVGENREYIEHGRSGLLTVPGDVTDLSRAIVALLSDRNLARELGQQACQRMWERYAWDARAGDVERVYRQARRMSGAG